MVQPHDLSAFGSLENEEEAGTIQGEKVFDQEEIGNRRQADKKFKIPGMGVKYLNEPTNGWFRALSSNDQLEGMSRADNWTVFPRGKTITSEVT